MQSQFSSVVQSCPTLCDPVDCSTPGFPVHHQLLELAQTNVYRVGDAINISSCVGPFSSRLQYSLVQPSTVYNSSLVVVVEPSTLLYSLVDCKVKQKCPLQWSLYLSKKEHSTGRVVPVPGLHPRRPGRFCFCSLKILELLCKEISYPAGEIIWEVHLERERH